MQMQFLINKNVLVLKKIREDKNIQIIFVTASEVYYENFRKQYYPEIGIDVNINCLQNQLQMKS
jgi:hypothetical protein